MFDPRILKLASGLVNFSCAVKPGENVLIQTIGGNEDLTRALIKEVYKAGGVPFLWLEDKNLDREIMLHCTPEQLTRRAKVDASMMEQMQAFIGIRGGEVYGPRLQGTVMAGGGDWQTIMPEGLTKVEARYFLKAADGTGIEVTNPGVRVASVEVVEKLARGEVVDPSLYYFRTTPNFKVNGGALDWMQRHAFVARGIRKPDSVVIDYYVVN